MPKTVKTASCCPIFSLEMYNTDSARLKDWEIGDSLDLPLDLPDPFLGPGLEVSDQGRVEVVFHEDA